LSREAFASNLAASIRLRQLCRVKQSLNRESTQYSYTGPSVRDESYRLWQRIARERTEDYK